MRPWRPVLLVRDMIERGLGVPAPTMRRSTDLAGIAI
jgi:hypothetical protein